MIPAKLAQAKYWETTRTAGDQKIAFPCRELIVLETRLSHLFCKSDVQVILLFKALSEHLSKTQVI